MKEIREGIIDRMEGSLSKYLLARKISEAIIRDVKSKLRASLKEGGGSRQRWGRVLPVEVAQRARAQNRLRQSMCEEQWRPRGGGGMVT